MTDNRGITLIEVLLVIAIVGVLLGLGVTGGKRLLDRARLDNALSEVEYQVRETRRLAKRLDRTITFEISKVDEDWFIITDGKSRRLSTTAAEELTISFKAPFGTYSGDNERVQLTAGSASGSVLITGVLARTVVQK